MRKKNVKKTWVKTAWWRFIKLETLNNVEMETKSRNGFKLSSAAAPRREYPLAETRQWNPFRGSVACSWKVKEKGSKVDVKRNPRFRSYVANYRAILIEHRNKSWSNYVWRMTTRAEHPCYPTYLSSVLLSSAEQAYSTVHESRIFVLNESIVAIG